MLDVAASAPTPALILPLSAVRWAGAAMLGMAVAVPTLPAHVPFGCVLYDTTGVPCPWCGLTRSVIALADWDLAGSLRFNPAGLVIVVLVLAALVRRSVRRVVVPLRPLVVGSGLLWAWNVTLNPTL